MYHKGQSIIALKHNFRWWRCHLCLFVIQRNTISCLPLHPYRYWLHVITIKLFWKRIMTRGYSRPRSMLPWLKLWWNVIEGTSNWEVDCLAPMNPCWSSTSHLPHTDRDGATCCINKRSAPVSNRNDDPLQLTIWDMKSQRPFSEPSIARSPVTLHARHTARSIT